MLPDRVALEDRLRTLGGSRLADVAGPYAGPVVNDGLLPGDAVVRYLDLDGVSGDDGLAVTDDIVFGRRPSRAGYLLRPGDILVANVRPNRGGVTFVTDRLAEALGSSGFTLLRPGADGGLHPLVLYVFLRTEWAREQLVRRCRGSMYPAVLGRDVFDIWVPAFSETEKRGCVAAAERSLAEQASFFDRQAELDALLDEFLAPFGAPPSPLASMRENGIDTTTVRRREALETAKRLDAEFFRREYVDFDAALAASAETFTLGDRFALSAGRVVRGEVLVPTLKQRVLTNHGVNWSAVNREPGRTGVAVVDGDVLLASTAHEIAYVGRKVDVVREMPEEVAGTNQAVAELMIIRASPSRPADVPSSYVAAFLRHPCGLHQVQRCIRGLRGGHTYPADLARYVRVPDPGRDWLERFEALDREAQATRRRARTAMADAVGALTDGIRERLR